MLMSGESPVIMLWGSTGWVGGAVKDLAESQGIKVVCAKSRLEHVDEVKRELEAAKAEHSVSHVFNAAGLTGRPNVDWCEDHKEEVVNVNVIGTHHLIASAVELGIHVTQFSTGCIYSYTDGLGVEDTVAHNEESPPNFAGSWYSATKRSLELLLRPWLVDNPRVLLFRLRMPVSDDLHHRSLVTKLIKYDSIINIPNSISILPELLPVALDAALAHKTGVYNLTNPGTITHNELLTMYKSYIDPGFTWKNFTMEEAARILKAPRSNTRLDASKITSEFPGRINPIHEALEASFKRMAAKGVTMTTPFGRE